MGGLLLDIGLNIERNIDEMDALARMLLYIFIIFLYSGVVWSASRLSGFGLRASRLCIFMWGLRWLRAFAQVTGLMT